MQKKHYLCSVIYDKIMRLVFASNNQHKLQEVCQILPKHITVLSLKDIGFCEEIDETGETLEENSALKAQTIWQWLDSKKLIFQVDGVFADDTGLEIDALGGKPGVRTARWAGEDCNDAANRKKALEELKDKENRNAQFRTVITLITKENTIQVEGVVRGHISKQEEGEGGFGYDPIFVPEGHNNTFASLPAYVKNSISHRARALEALKNRLND